MIVPSDAVARSPLARMVPVTAGSSLAAGVGVLNEWLPNTAAPGVDGRDVGGLLGAVLLLAACGAMILALWRFSPAWRPDRAGWIGVVVGGTGAVLTAYVIADAGRLAGEVSPASSAATAATGWAWLSAAAFLVFGLASAVLASADARTRSPGTTGAEEKAR